MTCSVISPSYLWFIYESYHLQINLYTVWLMLLKKIEKADWFCYFYHSLQINKKITFTSTKRFENKFISQCIYRSSWRCFNCQKWEMTIWLEFSLQLCNLTFKRCLFLWSLLNPCIMISRKKHQPSFCFDMLLCSRTLFFFEFFC